jgi:hypothetical protein
VAVLSQGLDFDDILQGLDERSHSWKYCQWLSAFCIWPLNMPEIQDIA